MGSGKISVVGTGPGAPGFLTARAVEVIDECDLVIGYRLYVNQVAALVGGKEIVCSAMGKEVERCRQALAEAGRGKQVVLVSGGDPGIYGMAGPMLQVAGEMEASFPVEIVPGVTAAGAAAALLGAPLTHDFAVISLSDLLTPWTVIERRLRAAAEADFVLVIYNPRSHGRSGLLARAREILLELLPGETAVGMVRGAGREGEKTWQATLEGMDSLLEEADMSTLVIIGNSQTYFERGKMITPRGYQL